MKSRTRRILTIVALIALVLLCLVAAGVCWAVGPAMACRQPAHGPAEAGWSARTVSSGGRERCYALYVPEAYDRAQPAPLVLSFHGFLSNPNSHALITGWHELADEEGFLVVYPQGSRFPQRWNAGPTWAADDVNDTQFFLDMLEDVSAISSVDPARIYVNGFSNGGGMTARIGCEAPGPVAAMGSVAGAVASTEGCPPPSRPVPIMVFHGTGDSVVPFEGGPIQHGIMREIARLVGGVPAFMGAGWVPWWVERNGCDPTPEVLAPSGEVYGVRYTGCNDGAEVVFYAVEEGGHTWPGGFPIPGVGKTSKDIDATREMWRFFETYRLEE